VNIDWTELVNIIVENVQQCVIELDKKFPNDDFYAFVLSALPSQYCFPCGVNFHANSKQRYEKYLNKLTELTIKKLVNRFVKRKNG